MERLLHRLKHFKNAVILSKLSESKDLRISLRFAVHSVPRSFDYATHFSEVRLPPAVMESEIADAMLRMTRVSVICGEPRRAMRHELMFFLVHPLGHSTISCYENRIRRGCQRLPLRVVLRAAYLKSQ